MSEALIVSAGILVATSLWSLLVGSVYLLLVSRRRGIVSRAECLVLGAAAAIALPGVAPLFD